MNPIVYNKNGQYRFTDFVGYLPEFLRSEPDVVTYLQVMSDYINNAYRNVEVTEEFEIIKVCTSTDRTVVQEWMNRLCSMFQLACDRGEHVMYLSAPRNNVKSNVTIGNANAEYQKTIDVDFTDIVDTVESASSRIGGAEALDDGDVVYLKYRKRELGELVAYYYVKDANILKKDPLASSQDPFTDTYNDPATAIQFNVQDVGKVICRYGGSHGKLTYYEVYFQVHVSNVERVSASGLSTYDVNADGTDDSIYVDYYDLTGTVSPDSGTYRTYIKFGDSNGFGWTGEYPTGLFYFRDSSSARLTNLSTYGILDVADPLLSPSVDKYSIRSIEKKSGVYRLFMDAFPGIYSNAVFYIMNGMESKGIYRMNGTVSEGDRFDDGKLYVDLVNISGTDYHIENPEWQGKLSLVMIPLASSKYIIDFDNKLPKLRWTTEVSDLFGNLVGVNSNIYMKRAKVTDNELLYKGKIIRVASNTIQTYSSLAGKINEGDMVWSPAFKGADGLTPYAATVISTRNGDDGLFRITLGNVQFVQAQLGVDNVPLYKLGAGLVYGIDSMTDMESDYVYFDVVCGKDRHFIDNDMIVISVSINGADPTDVLFRVDRSEFSDGSNSGRILVKKPFGVTVALTGVVPIRRVAVDENDSASIYAFRYIKQDADNTKIGVVEQNSYVGDIFTAQYMLATVNGSKKYSLLYMDTDVKKDQTSYQTGDYMYDPTDGLVYYITRTVKVNEAGVVEDTNSKVVDKIVHYSVGFKEILNSYMPYCGPVSTLDYDDKINYSGNMKLVRLPLYIKKVDDVRLKYGWQQREYMYYNDNIGVASRDRSGFIEMYSDNKLVGNGRNPVNVNLRKTAHVLPGNALLSGCGSRWYVIDVDAAPIAQRRNSGEWVVTIQSSAHGLSNGARITANVTVEEEAWHAVFDADDAEINVLSPDAFQYTTKADDVMGYAIALSDKSDITVQYDRSYYKSDDYPQDGDVVVVGPEMMPIAEMGNYEFRDDVYPIISENEIAVGGDLYLVNAGSWTPISPTDILTPHAIYSRHNLFETSVTNPTFAISDGYVIKDIIKEDDNPWVKVVVSKRIPELDVPNANEIYAGKGRVYIEFVNQGTLCGWHTIHSIENGGTFRIYVDPYVPVDELVAPIVNRQMTVHVGRWYKYTLKGYDWDKKSNLVSYATSNAIMEHSSQNPYRYTTKYKHNLSKGDHVLVDPDGKTVYNVSADNAILIKSGVVTEVVDDYTVELSISNAPTGYLFKGYMVKSMNIHRLNGEYRIKLDGEVVKFVEGDIVVTMAQQCLDERRAWKVSATTAWIPLAAKRTFKIDRMSVDSTVNPAFEAGDDPENEVEFKYLTYTDRDVVEDSSAYTIGYACARNYHFEHPYVEHLDTTQNTQLEYSSKYDYASVAPRDGMDPKFKGVPDMGYPLAERIERLAYLRDPEVLDIDLIGYLARFMGYDITAVADDISSSNIYRNSKEREAALREIIAHLPQYYALSGTKPGINMLMATFGLVGELVTMWTNTDDPYGKLIRQSDVPTQMDIDQNSGKTTSAWVPTPHVVLDIVENENFHSVLMGNEELNRMKEQIRCCKPIQVVFDGIRVVFNSKLEVPLRLVTSGGAIHDSTYVLDRNQYYDKELLEDPCISDDCSF